MATRRGPKVEPHKNPRLKNPIEKLMTEEEMIAQEEFINEVPELISDDEFITSLEAKTPHFELTHNGKDAVIDTLPQPKRKKTMDELSQTELRMYQKTGFLPEM